MSARDTYPTLARYAAVGHINGTPYQTETGREFAAALDEIDQLHSRVAALEAALTYAVTHEHDDDITDVAR